MILKMIHNQEELGALIMDIGILPFMKCAIPGFSLQECTPQGYWFVKDVIGPWEWREAVAEAGTIAYGKLFSKKAGFVSPAFYPDIVNYRRSGLDFKERYARGLCSHQQKVIMDLLALHSSMLTHELKVHAHMEKGFETTLSALQMQTDITVMRLEYKRDLHGVPYGWGQARYAAPEIMYGEALVHARFEEEPAVSHKRIVGHLQGLFPNASEKQILSVLKL